MTQKAEWFEGTQEAWNRRQAKTEEIIREAEREEAQAPKVHPSPLACEKCGRTTYWCQCAS